MAAFGASPFVHAVIEASLGIPAGAGDGANGADLDAGSGAAEAGFEIRDLALLEGKVEEEEGPVGDPGTETGVEIQAEQGGRETRGASDSLEGEGIGLVPEGMADGDANSLATERLDQGSDESASVGVERIGLLPLLPEKMLEEGGAAGDEEETGAGEGGERGEAEFGFDAGIVVPAEHDALQPGAMQLFEKGLDGRNQRHSPILPQAMRRMQVVCLSSSFSRQKLMHPFLSRAVPWSWSASWQSS